MSEVFEGIVCKRSATDVKSALMSDNFAANLVIEPFTLHGCIVTKPPVAPTRTFSSMEPIALWLSRQFDSVLLVRYDSRVGVRYSALFQLGVETQRFDRETEMYVPLDDAGEPLLDANWRRFSELDPNAEYETVQNAIELGFEVFGYGSWPELKCWIRGS
jgi:hypothetical protein